MKAAAQREKEEEKSVCLTVVVQDDNRLDSRGYNSTVIRSSLLLCPRELHLMPSSIFHSRHDEANICGNCNVQVKSEVLC